MKQASNKVKARGSDDSDEDVNNVPEDKKGRQLSQYE